MSAPFASGTRSTAPMARGAAPGTMTHAGYAETLGYARAKCTL